MIDLVFINVHAGDGGNGIVAFRREKNIPNGGPSGGHGGKGGSVTLVADQHMTTLLLFQRQRHYEAERGGNGGGNNRHGKNGADRRIEVPCGTQVWTVTPAGEEHFIGDLTTHGQELLVARGGRGGRGNTAFTSATQQAPYIAEDGTEGETFRLRLELKLLADVGIVGKPNAGKSTLLSVATAAKPKIAPYPFTTLEPIVGVVDTGPKQFVLTEIPGLIKGASEGTGLGLDFLRHATRTRLLIHLVDGGEEDVAQAVRDLDAELAAFGAGLPEKPQLIVVNKLDIPEVREKQEELAKALEWTGRPLRFISGAANVGVAELMEEVAELLETAPTPDGEGTAAGPITTLRPRHWAGAIHKDNEIFVVEDPRAVRFVGGSNIRYWTGRVQLKVRLDRLGVTKKLQEAGIKSGDVVRFGDIELEWTG